MFTTMFGSSRREQKAVDIGRVIDFLLRRGRVGGTYADRAEAGYQGNLVVYRAIRQLAVAVAQVEWQLFKSVDVDGKAEREEVGDHPVLDLIERPSKHYGRARFFEQLVSYLMLGGANYVLRITGVRNRAVTELRNLRPDLVKAVLDEKQTEVLRWEYSPSEKMDPVKYEPEDVLPLFLFNPLDEWAGQSPVAPAASAVDQSNLSREWNTMLLMNSGRPPGIITFEDALHTMDENEQNQILGKFREKQQGPASAGEPLLLSGGLKWEKTGLSPAELEWLEGQMQADRGIGVSIGVPPQVLGDTKAQTFANYQEARKGLYEDEVVPLLRWIASEFNRWILSVFEIDADHWLAPNLDGISALQENLNEISERAERCECATLDERREILGLERHGTDAGKVIVLKNIVIMPDGKILGPATLVPLDGAGGNGDGEGEEDDEAEIEEILEEAQRESLEIQTLVLSKKVFKTRASAVAWVRKRDFRTGADETEESWRFRQFEPSACRAGSFRTFRITRGVQAVGCRKKKSFDEVEEEFKAFNLETDEAKTAHWKAFDRAREAFVPMAVAMARKRLREEKDGVVRILRSSHGTADERASSVGVFLEGEKNKKAWRSMYDALYLTVGEHFARRVLESIPTLAAGLSDWAVAVLASPDWKQDDELLDPFRVEFARYLDVEAGKKITAITKRTLGKVRKELVLGVEAGEGTNVLASRIDRFLEDIIPHRAEVVARTEVINASNAASDVAARSTGVVKRKEWIRTRDARVRETHAAADGQVVSMDEPFIVGGAELMWPGDTSRGAPAEEVIQCRCTTVFLT